MNNRVKLIAFDLDGTLAQHKCPLERDNRHLLNELCEKFKLLIVGANNVQSVIEQINSYPIDVLANYGMEYAAWEQSHERFIITALPPHPTDREYAVQALTKIQTKHGYRYTSNIKLHQSGCITYSPLGLGATLTDKLAFDPDFRKRQEILPDVKAAFPDYSVYICGTTSFDIVPKPYSKYYALDRYCNENGISHSEVLYCGDNYQPDCNDYSIFDSDIEFVCVDDYKTLRSCLKKRIFLP